MSKSEAKPPDTEITPRISPSELVDTLADRLHAFKRAIEAIYLINTQNILWEI